MLQAIGLTVRTLMRMQLNIQVRNPFKTQNLNPFVDKTVLPIAWVEMVRKVYIIKVAYKICSNWN